MYTAEQLPDLTNQLNNSTDPEEITKCCLSASNIAQQMVIPDGQTPVPFVPELADESLYQGLINVVLACKEQPKLAVRNAVRALADISKMEQIRPKLIECKALEALKALLEFTAENGKATASKEVFSYSACNLFSNLLSVEGVLESILPEFTGLVIKLLQGNYKRRPAAAAFAASILKQSASSPAGKDELVKNGAVAALQDIVNIISSNPIDPDSREDSLNVIRLCCATINTLCTDPVILNDYMKQNPVDVLVKAFSTINFDFDPSQGLPENANLESVDAKNIYPLEILMKMINTDEDEAQLNGPQYILTMYFMLLHLCSFSGEDVEAGKTLSKLSLAIGGSFISEETPIQANQIINLLNVICRKFCKGDSEVVFIVTSLIVHLANFDHGVEGLQTEDSMSTRSELLTYFLEQEKSEVTQSILRNECVMLNEACTESFIIGTMAQCNIFNHLHKILQLHAELNSEITETVVSTLSNVVKFEEGRKEIQSDEFVTTLRQVQNFFSNDNAADERAEGITGFLAEILQNLQS